MLSLNIIQHTPHPTITLHNLNTTLPLYTHNSFSTLPSSHTTMSLTDTKTIKTEKITEEIDIMSLTGMLSSINP
jgi:hypothetical protein